MFEAFGPLSFSPVPITSFYNPVRADSFTAPTFTAPAVQTAPAKKSEDNMAGLSDIFTSGLTGLGGLISGTLGGVSSLAKTPGLGDALTLGLGSLFGGGKSSGTPMTIAQSQTVNQATQVDVQNVLGGQPFGGGVDAEGNFDTMKALSDVFKIRDAMLSTASGDGTTGGLPITSITTGTGKTNWTPILLIGGGLAALFFFMRKGK